jgi:hypothetical protein
MDYQNILFNSTKPTSLSLRGTNNSCKSINNINNISQIIIISNLS